MSTIEIRPEIVVKTLKLGKNVHSFRIWTVSWRVRWMVHEPYRDFHDFAFLLLVLSQFFSYIWGSDNSGFLLQTCRSLQHEPCDVPHWLGRRTKHHFTRVCGNILQTCFESLRGSLKGKAQRGRYLITVDLGRYKWYQSQIPDDVPAFSLFFEGG